MDMERVIQEAFDNGYLRGYEKGKADRPQEWIPCSERLPNKKEIVLITNDKGNVRFGQFRGTHGKYWIWKGNTLETVLAWMPLPKPYGEREGE
jgi:hypothetical protein